MSHSYTCRVFRRRIHFLTDKVLPSPSAAHDSIIPLPRLRSTTLVCYFQSWGHLNCRMNALALSPVFEQVLGIARLRGLPAPPLQHSYVHGAEDGTTSIRFSPIRCQCQTASGLYTPPPTYSPDGTSAGALVLSRPLPNDPASMASPLTVMPASHTRFCSIVKVSILFERRFLSNVYLCSPPQSRAFSQISGCLLCILPISAMHTILYGFPAMWDRPHLPDLQVRMPKEHCDNSRLLLSSITRSISLFDFLYVTL
ncbi:hypothetical protein BJ912DRAFT_641939 [Pholiota molesta]|nr:hypothetical protein BJ912DRAFT_641939 [Pholiota molesta]